MSYLQNFVFLFVFCIVFIDYGKCDVFGSLDMDKSKMLGNNEVRCYCNMAECITTGYMCKSQRLGCFSDLAAVTSPSSIEMVTHGCLDLLDKNLQTTCRNLPGKSDPLDSRAPKSLLLCCTEDMCNDVDIPGNRMDVNNQVFNLTDPLFDNKMAGKVRRPNLTFTTELFFRLATFAVPVLGAIMMFMLVTLAVKLLRSDANEDRMVAMKLRQNDAASLLLNKPHFPNSSANVNDFDASSKKVPLLYQYDRTHLPPASYHGNRVNLLYPILPGTPLEKNKTNAKLNNVSVPYNTPGANLEQPLLKINSGTFLQQGACNTFGAGSSLEQPLLKINSGNHLQQGNCNMFGATPLYNGWGAFAANKLGGQTFGQDGVNISAALNQFVSNVEGSASQNLVDSLSTSVNIEEEVPCCVTGSAVGNNVDGVTPRSDATSEVAGATDEKSVSGNVGATSSENLGNVPAIDGATGINVSVSNLATPMNVCATNHTNLSTASAATTESTSGTSQNTSETSGNTLETSAACFNPLETSKTNLPCPGYVVPCNISSTQGAETSVNLRLSTIPTQNLPKCQNVFPASSFVNANLPTVYGPFACVTTQATSDEHPIFSLQKSSELSLCSMNKCDCCNGCSSKCFEKNFSNHGCNLCQGVDNERLTTANSTASNNFDSEDDVKTNNYKKNLMPPFCAN